MSNDKPVGIAYPITVDYDLTIEEAVRLGGYDQSDANIASEHFATKRHGTAEIMMMLPILNPIRISADGALRELKKMALRPAEPRELLAFGAKYHDILHDFLAIALGSTWRSPNSGLLALALRKHGSLRRLYLYCTLGGWCGPCRFAAIREF
ncbi:hypothetical protein HY932_03000 [Candidatus Falkowbacteria bacterium]|nr:hypothetical protein [Candidatus Falkowbacteria bacterium]